MPPGALPKGYGPFGLYLGRGFLVWRAAVPAPLSYGPVPCHIDVKHRRLGQIKTPEPICRALSKVIPAWSNFGLSTTVTNSGFSHEPTGANLGPSWASYCK